MPTIAAIALIQLAPSNRYPQQHVTKFTPPDRMEVVEMIIIIVAVVGSVSALFFIGGCVYGWWNQRRHGHVLPS